MDFSSPVISNKLYIFGPHNSSWDSLSTDVLVFDPATEAFSVDGRLSETCRASKDVAYEVKVLKKFKMEGLN